jgi:hypothetical protein
MKDMLDRKVQDIDASIELLEDRIKQDKLLFLLTSVMGIVLMIVGLSSWTMEAWFVMDFSMMTAIILLVTSSWMLICAYSRKQLVFFKKYMELKSL